jgi:hypothetical protein
VVRRRARRTIATEVADAREHIPDEPVDVVVTDSLLTLFGTEGRERALRAWHDGLRPGGRVVTTLGIAARKRPGGPGRGVRQCPAHPAQHAGAHLRLHGAADRRWRAGATRAARLTAGWWGYDAAPPRVRTAVRPTRRRRRTALCFTGGVDSFDSLRRARPDVLLYVTGYDVTLADEDRPEGSRRSCATSRARRAPKR